MIRIYFDWDIISKFKTSDFLEIRNFIEKHKKHFLFPYSPTHFKDLMKSYNLENVHFKTDLDNLEYLSEKHLIRWGTEGIEPLFATPKEYFEGEKDNDDIYSLMDIEKIFSELDEHNLGIGKIGSLMKTLYQLQPTGIQLNNENSEMIKKMFPNISENSTMWDLMKDIPPFSKKLSQNRDYYKDFRKSIGDKGFKLETNSGNWSENEVFEKIDNFLLKQNTNLTFIEYVKTIFKHKNEPGNRFGFYTTAYLLLDMIGYKSDKLPKPTDNMQNIQNDAEHSFYAAHCDYFVVIDKKLRIKSRVLYKKLNINTIVISPKEFIDNLSKVIHSIDEKTNFIQETFRFCKSENIVENYPLTEENEVETFVFKLPLFYFNFFNYVVYQNFPKQNCIILIFKRFFKNYSSFIYYTEVERLVDRICDFFGEEDKKEDEMRKKKREFVYENLGTEYNWQFQSGLIKLEKDDESGRPLLIYIIPVENEC